MSPDTYFCAYLLFDHVLFDYFGVIMYNERVPF